MIINDEYYKKERNVKLTNQEIEYIKEELNRVPHNIFEFLNYNKIIKKLQKAGKTK